ncbi:MAG: FKBP-type peptidyl-prolyl cis-trans isomerase [Chitinophagaceae bacterium]
MKKLLLPIMLLTVSGMIWAQSNTKSKPAVKTSASKPVLPQPSLKNLSDSASYAIGVSVASFYKQQGITNLNTSLVSKAINDILGGKKPLMDDEAASMCVNKLLNNMQESKSQPTIEAGKAFLAKNGKRPEVKTTPSGLQYEVITEGTGIKPTAADTFVVHYRGTLIDGTEFDASYNRNQPLVYPMTAVIHGWTEGLQLMAIGSKYKFYIPYNLAYGTNDNGQIPGGSTLIFEIEMLDVKKAK